MTVPGPANSNPAPPRALAGRNGKRKTRKGTRHAAAAGGASLQLPGLPNVEGESYKTACRFTARDDGWLLISQRIIVVASPYTNTARVVLLYRRAVSVSGLRTKSMRPGCQATVGAGPLAARGSRATAGAEPEQAALPGDGRSQAGRGSRARGGAAHTGSGRNGACRWRGRGAAAEPEPEGKKERKGSGPGGKTKQKLQRQWWY